jgi:predicted MFS family arabinose efflux permease
MNRNGTAMKVMWALSIAYGATIGIVAALHGPVGQVAWIGAIALGLGYSVSSVFARRERQE